MAAASRPAAPAFTLITLDYNDGSDFVPGAEQLATPGGSVNLRAQVIDSASGTYTYSWTTAGLTDATSISGASTYDLTFQWNTSISTAKTESTTLTVTDPNSNQVSQTVHLLGARGDRLGHRRHHLAVVARPRPDPGRCARPWPARTSRSSRPPAPPETSIDLPSFNPNVSPVSLQYDSLSANALPIVDVEHPLDPTKTTPSQVTAQLHVQRDERLDLRTTARAR